MDRYDCDLEEAHWRNGVMNILENAWNRKVDDLAERLGL